MMDKLHQISPIFTKEFLSERLSEWFQKDVIATDVQFQDSATGKGDSYMSEVYRVTICGKIKSPVSNENADVSVPIFIKTLLKNIAMRKTFRSHMFFKNEINFYNIVMPELMKFQAGKKMKDPFLNLPRIFAAVADGENDILAMEDLRVLNYGMPVRQEHIDPNHINIIIDTFAKYHALSFAFKDQHPEKYEEITSSITEMYYHPKVWDWYKGYWKHLCGISLDAMHKEHPGTKYQEKVKQFATDETYLKLANAASRDRDSAVMSHGDAWTPNFLFLYENDIPVSSKMIDFQLARSATPIIDVTSFIYACGSDKEYLNNFDNILKRYYDKLADQIRDLGSDPDKVYSWNAFTKEVKELSFSGVGFAMEATPVTVLEPDDAMASEAPTGTEALPLEQLWQPGNIKTKRGRQRLCDIFIHAIDRGYI